jgi:hypothetical protein
MSEKYNIDSVIETVLKNDTQNIDVDTNSFELLRQRIETSNRSIISSLKKKVTDYKVAMRFNTTKAVFSLLCSLVLVIGLSGVFVPTVRVAAVNVIESYIYLPIKNSVGEYITEKISTDKVKVVKYEQTDTTLSDAELSKELGYTVKIPLSLTDKYTLSKKWLITGFKGPKDSFAAGIYKPKEESDKAKFILYIASSKSEGFKQISEASKSPNNKNQKELIISNKTLLYYESPILKGVDEIEKGGKVSKDFYKESHEVLTNHTINWEQDRIGYSLTDNGNNLSFEDMKAVVAEIINNK